GRSAEFSAVAAETSRPRRARTESTFTRLRMEEMPRPDRCTLRLTGSLDSNQAWCPGTGGRLGDAETRPVHVYFGEFKTGPSSFPGGGTVGAAAGLGAGGLATVAPGVSASRGSADGPAPRGLDAARCCGTETGLS